MIAVAQPPADLAAERAGARSPRRPASIWRDALRPPQALAVVAAILLLSLAAAAVLPGADAGAADKPATIRIGFAATGVGGVQAVGYSAIGTAQMKGLLEQEFAKDGITIAWTFFRGAGPAVNEALANGQLDFAWQGDFPAIIGRANGLDTHLILAAGQRTNSYLAVRADSPAKTLADLVGKKVAFFKGTNIQLVIDKALADEGYGEKDFQSINLDTLSGQPALVAGEIDGLWGSIDLIAAERAGKIRFVYSTRGKSARLTKQAHLLVTGAFERAHADLVQRVVEVLVREAAWESDESHRQELFALWSRSGYPVTTWEEEFTGTPLALRESPLLDDFVHARYREAMEAAKGFRLIRSTFDVDAWFESKYVDQAIADLHLEHTWQPFTADGSPVVVKR